MITVTRTFYKLYVTDHLHPNFVRTSPFLKIPFAIQEIKNYILKSGIDDTRVQTCQRKEKSGFRIFAIFNLFKIDD